jgi:hypothetical protein
MSGNPPVIRPRIPRRCGSRSPGPLRRTRTHQLVLEGVELLLQVTQLLNAVLLRRVLELQRGQLLLQAGQLLLHLAQARLARWILLRLQRRRLHLQLQLPALQLVDDLGGAVERHAHARGRFIEQIDCAVG